MQAFLDCLLISLSMLSRDPRPLWALAAVAQQHRDPKTLTGSPGAGGCPGLKAIKQPHVCGCGL